MKLQNKKTGEIISFFEVFNYNSLAELTEEWEDYEEPDAWWYIDRCYEAHATNSTLRNMTADQEIGNYFSTREDVEKALEKLKAWKRLKDKDFQFHGHNALGVGEITFSLDFKDMDDEGEIGQLRHDLDLLFGGEA